MDDNVFYCQTANSDKVEMFYRINICLYLKN